MRIGLPARERKQLLDADIVRLNGEGASDSEIGRRTGIHRHAVSLRRKALKLPDRSRGVFVRSRIGEGLARARARLGIHGFVVYRQRSWREKAAADGWPLDVNGRITGPAHLRILNGLWSGPKTLKQLRVKQGSPQLRDLIACGLVVCLGMNGEGGKSGYRVNLYAMAIDVERD